MAHPSSFGVYEDDGSGSYGEVCSGSPKIKGVSNNMRVTKHQSLYIISAGLNLFKVGVAKHPENRRKALQTGNPQKLVLEGWTALARDGVDAKELERLIHSRLSSYRLIGEWFQTTPTILGRAFKESWVQLRSPELYQRWMNYKSHVRNNFQAQI